MFAEIELLVMEGDAAGLAAKVSELSAERRDPPPPARDEEAASRDPQPVGDGDAPVPLVHSPGS
jgi:hypothetical protein